MELSRGREFGPLSGRRPAPGPIGWRSATAGWYGKLGPRAAVAGNFANGESARSVPPKSAVPEAGEVPVSRAPRLNDYDLEPNHADKVTE